ncbi:MAG: gas vesicle protein GvpG [Proteobacteria bacterium]|nr:gas vesicle protein GvpG [Pseudomonadota bacterium]
MLIIDDILLFPIRGIMRVFKEVYNAAKQEMSDEADAITAELSELYMMLETGQISEIEFNSRERVLLDKMDMIQAEESRITDKDEEETDEEEIDDEENNEDSEDDEED